MSKLNVFDLDQLGDAELGGPLPGRIVDGNPAFKTWVMENNGDGALTAGVWEVDSGSYKSIKGDSWEFCYILSGLSELTEDGQAPRQIGPGDAFVMQPGYVGTWRALEPTKKIWIIRK